MKPIIIIPAYNENDNILGSIEKIKLLNCDYIIINDCSSDNTVELLKQYQHNYLDLPINVGISLASQIGFKYAIEFGYDSVIVIDGDGQHQPEYIQTLLNGLNKGYDCLENDVMQIHDFIVTILNHRPKYHYDISNFENGNVPKII